MSAPANQRFYNIKGFTFTAAGGGTNSTAFSTLQEVTTDKKFQELSDSGDDEAGDSFLAKTGLQAHGSIVMRDSVQAATLFGLADGGTVAFDCRTAKGQNRCTVTISGVMFLSHQAANKHKGIANNTIAFRAYKPDGTDPIAIAASVTAEP